jgi:hypothetical protein
MLGNGEAKICMLNLDEIRKVAKMDSVRRIIGHKVYYLFSDLKCTVRRDHGYLMEITQKE